MKSVNKQAQLRLCKLGYILGALKSPIFVVQKAAAPKFGVEFRQGSNDTIRSSLAMLCDVSRRRARSPNFDQSVARKLSHTDRHTDRQTDTQRIDILEGPALRAAPSKKNLGYGLTN